MKNKKVCLIGLGNIGMVHLDAYLKLENIDITIIDINKKAKKIAEKYYLKYSANIKDALKPDFDIVDICTPTYLHYSQIKLCLKNTKAVIFCEKPLTTSLKEATELLRISKNKKRLILCAMVERFNEPFIKIKRELKKVNSPYKIFLTRKTKKPLYDSWYEKEKLGGGIINDLGVHDIDLLMYLTNEYIINSSIKKDKVNKNAVIIDLSLSKGGRASIILKRDLSEKCADGVQNSCKVFCKNKEVISYKSDSEILMINFINKNQIKVNKRFPVAYYDEIRAAINIVNGKKNTIFPSSKQLLNCIQTLNYLNKKWKIS